MSLLKDHLYSAGAGVAGAGVAAGAVGVAVGVAVTAVTAVAGAAGAAGAAGLFVAGATLVAGAAGVAAVADAVASKAETFKPLSALGGAGLTLAAAFGAAGYLGPIDLSETSEHADQKSEPVQMISSERQYSDAAQAFNVANNDTAVTASMDAQGDYVLTVNPKAPALS